MRIAYISTFPPIECGIGYYTKFLVESMRQTHNEVYVISHYGAHGNNVLVSCSSKDGDLSKKLFDMTDKVTPDLVHIQHEYGLFGDMDGIAVLDLIYRCKSVGIPVFVTLHTVQRETTPRRKMIMEVMCRETDRVFVHEKEHIEYLRDIYHVNQGKIDLIPHGARMMPPYPDAKEKLNLDGKKVILLIGYFRETKCFDKIVKLFPAIVEKVPDSCLVISGKMRSYEHLAYRDRLFDEIDASPVRDNIEVFRGQFPQKTFDYIISASDVIVFPYSAGAQSGVMANAFAFGKPVVTSALPAFKSIIAKAGCGFTAETDSEYVEYISKLLVDTEIYRSFSGNARKYVEENISWDIVVNRHIEIYRNFDSVRNFNSRYIYID